MQYKNLFEWYDDIHIFVQKTNYLYSEILSFLPYELDIFTALEIKRKKEMENQ